MTSTPRTHGHRSVAALLLLGSTLALAACGGDATAPDPDVELAFDFDEDTAGWTADFVDFPEGRADDVAFEAGVRELPDPLDGRALFHRGHNISDDLFMFFARRHEGLEAGATYRARFQVEIASDAGQDCDVGKAANVYVKAGASGIEPARVVDEDGTVRLNIDKGSQKNSGENAVMLGDIRNGRPGCGGDVPFARETVHSTERITVTADDEGGLWLLLGSESAFEVAHQLHFTAMRVSLERVSD